MGHSKKPIEDSVGDDAYRELFERSADAILIIDEDRFIDCNDAAVHMLRYTSREDVLQTHPWDLSPERQPDGRLSFEAANDIMQAAFEKGSQRFEWEHRRADGEVFPIEVLLTAVPKAGRRLLCVVWHDISERKRLEDELRQAQKMEAVGKLAGGVAHDFNNLLVAILGHADLLGLKLDDEPDLKEHLDEIRRASQRAAALVTQLLAFSRKQVLQPKLIDLNTVMLELSAMLDRLLGEDISIVHDLTLDPLFVHMDPGKLEQVIINLSTNARDAMPGGGQLKFATDRQQLPNTADDLDLPAGHYARLSVTDTGHGIDADTLERIFDPFFTTKGQGQGTGLGLATVYGIVKQSGGDTTVRSVVGEGATFCVYLPLSDAHVEPVREIVVKEAPASGGKERILLVEDEAPVLRLVERVLRDHGYDVHTATNGAEALGLFEHLEGKIDLLLTDVVMPRMGGAELARRLTDISPSLRVLYSSGYTDDALSQRGILGEDVELIEKPFPPNELLHRVRRVLDDVER